MAPRHVKSEPRLQRLVVWDGGGHGEHALRRDDTVGEVQRLPSRPTYHLVEPTTQRRPLSEASHDQAATFGTSIAETGKPTPAAQRPASIGSRQLLRMIETLDDILLLRTQAMHQLEMLRVSRTFLESSLQYLDAHPDSAGPTGPLSSEQADSQTVVDAEHQTRTIPAIEVHARTELLSDSATAAPGEPLVSQASGKAVEPQKSFKALLAEFRQDLNTVRQQEKDFSAALESLSMKEYRLSEKQKALVEDLKVPTKAKQIVDQIDSKIEVPPGTPDSPGPASEVPSIVQRFFDRSGDVGVWHERRLELMDAWDEGAAEREIIADRDDPLEVTDEEFNAKYEERLAYIDRELEIARDEAEDLKAVCLVDGYNIEQFRRRRRSSTPSDSLASLTVPHSVDLKSVPDFDLAMHVSPPTTQQPVQSIDTWLRAVTQTEKEVAEDKAMPLPGLERGQQPEADPSQLQLAPSPHYPKPPDIIAYQESPPQIPLAEPAVHAEEGSTTASLTGFLPVQQSIVDLDQLTPLTRDENSTGPAQPLGTETETRLTQSSLSPRALDESPTNTIDVSGEADICLDETYG